jgi:hypothetical protein
LQGSPFIAWLIDGMPMMDANSHRILMVYDIPIACSETFLLHSLHRCWYGYETGPKKNKG